MTSKRISKMNMPEVNLYIVIVGIASIFLLYYNFYLGGLFFIGFIYMVINNWKTTNIRRKEWTNYIQNLSLDIDETTKKAVMNLPIPLCILEFDGKITWYNRKFNTMIGQDDLLGVNIDNLIKNLNLRKVLNENKEMYTDINYKDREYDSSAQRNCQGRDEKAEKAEEKENQVCNRYGCRGRGSADSFPRYGC